MDLSSIDWAGLLRGELLLILTVSGGLALGKGLIALSLPERLMGSLMPFFRRRGLPPELIFSLAVSLGSSRAGVALVAEAHREGRLTRREAVFGTLLQSFPGYLKRWIVFFPTACGLAGAAGAIYSLAVLLRSFCRFLFFMVLLRRKTVPEGECAEAAPRKGGISLGRTLARTLPLACTFYALAYILSPFLQSFLEERGAFFPLLSSAGWTVAAASFAHVTAALGVTGGAIASGALTTAQGVLALLVGNMLAVLSRVFRQDIAFWIGIFPVRMVRSLFVWNLVTLVVTMAVTVALASIPVLWGW
jgi:hypothetical protein